MASQVAERAQPAASAARDAARLCRAGKLDEAAVALRGLEQMLTASLGEEHSATRIVRLNLAHVERALGQDVADTTRPPAEPREEGTAQPVDPSLARALKGLRSCASVGVPGRRKREPSGTSSKSQLETQLAHEPLDRQIEAARKLASRGRYRDALLVAESAARLAEQNGDVQDRIRASETLALVRLQLGDATGAREAARTAEAHARRTNAVETRITMARLLAQVGDLEAASIALEELAPLARSTRVVGELEEARGDLQIRLGSPGLAAAHLDRAL
jgi:tetratricopeptide (TPR) repeat protein